MTSDLEPRLKTLMGVRLVMATTLLLVAAYLEASSDYLLPFNPFYVLIGAIYGLTVVHALSLRFVRPHQLLVYAQVIGDLLAITGLVYLTGGSRAGFTLLYPLSVLSGSILLLRGGGMALAALATLCYAGILWSVRVGLVAPQGLSDIPFASLNSVLYSVFVTGVTCTTVGLVGSYLSTSLRSTSERLEEASVQVADLQQLNQVIVSSIHSGLLTANKAGVVLYVNEYGAQLLGRRAAELRERGVEEVFGSSRLSPAVLSTRSQLRRFDLVYTRPDGERVDLGLSVSPLAIAEEGYLFAFQDLTDVKRLERDLRANERLAAVGEMAAQIAHEIRNPLGSISGSAQVLLAELQEPNISPEQARLLDIIRRESKRLSDSLTQFLYQARATPAPNTPVDLREVIERAVTLLRNGSEVRPGHVIEFEADQGPHLCLADADKMTQVFWNLARNALEAMPHGGRLLIRLARRPDQLVLSVRDEGRGISREQARSVFEPFRSGDAMGTGIGLAVVYSIVREHRGAITVRSIPLQGTEFEVHLPQVAAPVTA